MNEFLIQHALKNVWCSPDQDHQYLFRPTRISPDRGVKRSVDIEWGKHWLPDKESTYHVYQIGQIAPRLLNLIPDQWNWYSFTQAMNTENITLDAYNHQGRQLPRFECFFRKTPTRNLVVAVKENPRICNLPEDTLYIRFYSNAYFGSERSEDDLCRIFTEGMVAGKRAGVVDFKRRAEKFVCGDEDNVSQFHNGWLVDTLRPGEIKDGDKIEYVVDASIKELYDADVKDLHTFNSKLDTLRKYLVRRPKGATDTIDFHDDIDIWLVKKDGPRENGVFFHKGLPASVRMITHQDVSVAVEHLLKQIRDNSDWLDPSKITLRLKIRRSGYDRPLVQDHNRIKDLYQLKDGDITRAMVGANATVDEWQAANLENSCYTAIMRSSASNISKKLVQCAYGYHGVVNKIAHTPQVPHTLPSGEKGIIPPWRLRFDSTFYEYDRKGRLIDWIYDDRSDVYQMRHVNTGYVEGFVGRGGVQTSTEYARYTTPITPGKRYKVYVCDVIAGEPNYQWREAVPLEEYVYHKDEIIWLVEPAELFTAVREETRFLSDQFKAKPHQGIIKFTIESEDLVGELRRRRPVYLPFGKLDLFLNGHSLIEGLDYFVKWPEVVICNKEYLKDDPESQSVTVRAYGFLTPEGKRHPRREFGFVNNGLLSVNNRYDVREGINLRYVADGRLWDRKDLQWAEEDWGVRHSTVRNGAPYLVDEILVPLKDVEVVEDVCEYREASLDVDHRISDYLTRYLQAPDIPNVNLIPRRYRVLSPFASRVHHDLLSGYLYPEDIERQYSDEDIREWLAPYEWLLDFDPVIQGYDSNYVNVHPHESTHETVMSIYKYNFFKRVIDVYLQGSVNLSTHVRLKEGWV